MPWMAARLRAYSEFVGSSSRCPGIEEQGLQAVPGLHGLLASLKHVGGGLRGLAGHCRDHRQAQNSETLHHLQGGTLISLDD